MSDSSEISADILQLFDATPGESYDLVIRQFATDIEAHDPELQERYAAEMAANFQSVITILSESFGLPTANVRWDDDVYDAWLERLPISFNELAAWERSDGHHFYVLNHHEDRELPLLIMAGVTS